MKFYIIIILIIGINSEKYIGIFKITNSIDRIKYRHTLLCGIECLKTKDCDKVHIRDKKCEIQVNCPFSNFKNSVNDGSMLENVSKKNSSLLRGKRNCEKSLNNQLNFFMKKQPFIITLVGYFH